MKQIIVHLSDIHFRVENNELLKRQDNLARAISSEIVEVSDVIILVSGDIAFSGQKSEYDVAEFFFNNLLVSIKQETNILPTIFFCPGNHDRDHSYKEENTNLRHTTFNSITNGSCKIDEGIINLMTEVQEEYFNFQTKLNSKPENIGGNRLFNKYKIPLKHNKSIILYTYNSAWISKLNEDPGELFFPNEIINREYFEEKSDLSISMIHHPFNWNSPDNSKNFLTHLTGSSDIIYTGHEHDFSGYLKESIDGDYTEFIEADSLQDPSIADTSGFNIIKLDLENERHLINKYVWNGKNYITNNNENWLDIKRNDDLKKGEFRITDSFKGFLENPGANFTNKRKAKLNLSDIYIYPDLKVIKFTESSSTVFDKFINSVKTIEFSDLKSRLIYTGEERSGKTAFCKVIFRSSFLKKLIPIYIEGSEISQTPPDEIEKLINNKFKEQYEGDLDTFKQLPREKKVIIIDDLEKSKLKSSHRNNFIRNLSNHYKKIVITGTNLIFLLDYLKETKDSNEEFRDFDHYELIPFGPKLRDKLIRKWLNINVEDKNLILDEETYKELDYVKRNIDIVLGKKSFIPAYPFFLLTLLQAAETGKQHNLDSSQYGSYYELLINMSLHKISKKQEIITFYDNFLVEFCFNQFKNEIWEFSEDSLNTFYNWYKDVYDIDNHLGIKEIIKNLKNANIIKEHNNQYSIFYKYIYYYYVAKYFRENLHTDTNVRTNNKTCKEEIRELIDSIHVEESANILMFLSHLSNDPFIYNLLKDKAKSIFAETEVAKLENDIKEINELTDEIPSLVLEAKTVEQARRDKIEVEDKQETEDLYSNDDSLDAELEIITKLNSAIKTIEIAGQISRQYYAKIKADDKLELVEEVFKLGFRTMHLFLSSIAQNKELIISEIESYIEKDKGKTDAELSISIRQYLFYLSLITSHSIIKKISTSIGSVDLSKTYDKVFERMPFAATELTHNCIKLEFNKGISRADIILLKKRLKKNILAYTLLKQQVIDYIYTYPVESEYKAWICSVLDITIKEQIIIEKTSRTKR